MSLEIPSGLGQVEQSDRLNQLGRQLSQLSQIGQKERRVIAQLLLKLPPTRSWRWSVICLGILGLFGGIGLSAYIWLAGLPPLPDCEATTPLSPDAHRLYCAQETARSGKLEDLQAGIALVKNWSPDHPLYRDAQASLTKWSRLVLLIARDKMQHNDFAGAAAAISQIPAASPVYAEAQQTLNRWQAEWQKGEALYAQAMEAVQQQNWGVAFGYVSELGNVDHDYWRLEQADRLANQILVQKESQEALKQAKKLAKRLAPEHMGAAIEQLQAVAPETQAWAEAQQLLTEWSQFLSRTALQYWREGNPAMAQELARQIPLNPALPSDAQDLVRFSHAQQLVADSQMEAKVSWKQVWQLTEATTALKQIQSSSPLYSEAQTKLQDWQDQLQDLQQLQMATWWADLGQKPALQQAIAAAQQISSDRPRYTQAQNLVDLWQSRVERIEDLPFLLRAQQFAAPETVENLQLAIAQASVVPSHRGLWTEVQAQITAWTFQIERIEDLPILERAQSLAKANKLEEAIAAAAEIRPERSLYAEAQAAITSWTEKIRAALVAEDQSILDRARQNAAQSHLTEAIAAAAEITPGRPLYLEAQAAIGAWLRERDGSLKSDSADLELEPDSAVEPALDTPPDSSSADPILEETGDSLGSEPSSDLPAESLE